MADAPKRIKRLLREYAGAAHEEELRRALLPVSEAFGRWARRELGNGELSEIIHRFHQGPARELWVRYNTSHLEMAVAFAITTGVLGRETIPAELLEHLAGALRFYEEEQADNPRDRNQELEGEALTNREPSSIGVVATAQVYQFKLVLLGVEPPIWRRIQVPETYSFWDLHVALQDAMGWLDYHLHVFRVAGLEPPPAKIETDSISFIAAVLRNSNMLSFATSQVLPSEMDGVVPLQIPGLTMTRSAGILFRSTAGITPATRAFIEAIKRLAQELGTN